MKLDVLSATRIKTYKDCPFKYYLTYETDWQSPPNFGALQGTLVHEILEGLARPLCKNDQGNSKGDADQINKKNWKKYLLSQYRKQQIWTYDKKAWTKKCDKCIWQKNASCKILGMSVDEVATCPRRGVEDAAKLVKQVTQDKGDNSPFNRTILDVEKYFELEIKDASDIILVKGYIDIVTEIDDDTIEVMDYKTGSWTQSYPECRKDPQFLIYHLAAKTIYSKYNNILIVPYYMRKIPIVLAFDDRDDHKTIKALLYYWHKIKEDKCPLRRCDKNNGVNYDWKCNALCDPETCEKEYRKFLEKGEV